MWIIELQQPFYHQFLLIYCQKIDNFIIFDYYYRMIYIYVVIYRVNATAVTTVEFLIVIIIIGHSANVSLHMCLYTSVYAYSDSALRKTIKSSATNHKINFALVKAALRELQIVSD